jgi:hypothetical protein
MALRKYFVVWKGLNCLGSNFINVHYETFKNYIYNDFQSTLAQYSKVEIILNVRRTIVKSYKMYSIK